MTQPLSATELLRSTLNALAMRQRTIANNISNVDTPGFKASHVRFEEHLAGAVARGRQSAAVEPLGTHPGHMGSGQAQGLTPELQTDHATSQRNDGNNVDIDQQMILLAETALNYGALARLASQRLSLLRTAITEGRR